MPHALVLASYSDLAVPACTVDLAEVTNPLCRRFLSECDGKRSVAAVRDRLFLPQTTTIKVVQRCVAEGWLKLMPSGPFQNLWSVLVSGVGEERARALLRTVVSRAVRKPTTTVEDLYAEGLFAFEMLLTPEEAQKLQPALDALRPS